MKHATVMVMSSIFKELFNSLRRTFYCSVYKCILQNMKHVKVMYVYFLRVVQTFYIERFTICFINNQGKNTKFVVSPDITLCG